MRRVPASLAPTLEASFAGLISRKAMADWTTGWTELRMASGETGGQAGVMKQEATLQIPLRRVGAAEGVLHIAGAAALFICAAQPFEFSVALAVPPAAGVFWAGWYGALRSARVRDWFGEWDAVSFGFVAAYAVGLAFAAQVMLAHW